LSKLLGGQTKILGEKVVKSDKCMGVSQLLGVAHARADPQVYAYALTNSINYKVHITLWVGELSG